ncbi:MAG: sialate O-acetylesterase [bacterium]|nr:sialate O-acetylesterase [bacterium]
MRLKFALLGVVVASLLAATVSPALAEVKLASIFGDSMVLQQGMEAPVWGWADADEKVTVKFGDQTKTAVADKDGRWQVKLDALKASSEGAPLTVSGSNEIQLKDVLVGEVWICSGQSNMEWALKNTITGKEQVAASANPQIRLYNVPGHLTSATPLKQNPGSWKVSDPSSSAGFSAVGYHFGKRLQAELGVPVGLIGSNWGGTRIEPWTTLEGFQSVPELKSFADGVAEMQKKGSAGEAVKIGGSTPAAIGNAMIQPLAPFATRGAIWYQGESNGGEGVSYYHKKKALVNGWRKLFNPDLAFYWVQLANFRQATDDPAGGDGWAKLREAQLNALDIPHTGMAVIIDIGEAKDIHPRNKIDVGSRLAQWALHQTYKKSDIVPSGPLYDSHKVEGDAIRLTFKNTGSGLMVGAKSGVEPTAEVSDGKLQRFAIAGEDKKWHWAEATIDGDTIVVKSKEVKNPVAVRYAFSMNPVGANLYNKEGLPASPFRTDEW